MSDENLSTTIYMAWPPFTNMGLHGFTNMILIPASISNYTNNKVWDETTSPFPNFNGTAAEVQ